MEANTRWLNRKAAAIISEAGVTETSNIIGLDSLFAQFYRENGSGIFGISVYRGIGNNDSRFFRLVGAPEAVFFNVISDVASPYKAVKRTDHFYIKSGSFFEERLYLGTVFSDNIAIVASCFGKIIAEEIHFVSEHGAV